MKVVLAPSLRNAIQRDLGMIERWAQKNLMKFCQSKCKVLHLGWDNPSKIQTG